MKTEEETRAFYRSLIEEADKEYRKAADSEQIRDFREAHGHMDKAHEIQIKANALRWVLENKI